jgi:hydroxymethylpyrimidine pyrophosphatase-like HAD family hydrolase
MVMPPNVTKLTGVLALLDRLGIDPTAFAAIGDGENDLELLAHARVSGAPSNAVPVLRPVVSFLADRPMAEGVGEFVEFIAASGMIPTPR